MGTLDFGPIFFRVLVAAPASLVIATTVGKAPRFNPVYFTSSVQFKFVLRVYFTDISAGSHHMLCDIPTQPTHPYPKHVLAVVVFLSYDLCIRFSSSVLFSWRLEGHAKIFASVSAAPFCFLRGS